MKKTIIIILVIVALPLYSYNLYLLVRMGFAKSGQHSVATNEENDYSFEQLLAMATPVRFEQYGRDPFMLKAIRQKKSSANKKSVKKKKTPAPPAAPPPITVTGIMWNPNNPVAMVKLPGGGSKLVKAGQEIGSNITVKSVEKKSIVVLFEGSEFTIQKR